MLRRTHPNWSVCVAAATLSVGLLVLHGLIGTPEGDSAKFNQPWFEAFHRAFWSGELYPRFLSDLWFGIGGQDFYFYGPLPFWFASLAGELTCIGCSPQIKFSLAGAWMICLSGLTFFLFARRFFVVPWAGLGGIIYALLPYHYLVNWYSRQAIGEVAAMMIVPLLALATIRLVEDRKGGRLFAISLAALTFSHLPSLVIVTLLIAAILLWQIWHEKNGLKQYEIVLRVGAWALLGVGLSAVYWIPALAFLHTVSPEMLSNAYSDPTRWLLLDGRAEINPTVSALFKPYILACLTISVSVFLTLNPEERSSSLGIWTFGATMFVLFMMSVFSYPVWKFWILSKVQFPWRTLIIADLAIALGSVVAIKALFSPSRLRAARYGRGFAVLSGALLIFSYSTHTPRTIESINNGLARSDQTLWVGAPEYLPSAFLRHPLARFRLEVQPEQTIDQRYALFNEKIRLARDEAFTALQSDAPGAEFAMRADGEARLRVSLPRAASLRIPLAGWMNWRARFANGIPLPLSEDPELGVLKIDLPSGHSEVEFYLTEAPLERFASVLTWLASMLLVLGFFDWRDRFQFIDRYHRHLRTDQKEPPKALEV